VPGFQFLQVVATDSRRRSRPRASSSRAWNCPARPSASMSPEGRGTADEVARLPSERVGHV